MPQQMPAKAALCFWAALQQCAKMQTPSYALAAEGLGPQWLTQGKGKQNATLCSAR